MTTKIIDEQWMPEDLAALPRWMREGIAAAVDRYWDTEEADYWAAPAARRKGHLFEHLNLLRHWLEGHDVARRVDTGVWCTNPEPDPASGYHYSKETRRKSVGEVRDELLHLVGTETEWGWTVDGASEYFDAMSLSNPDRPWPAGRIVVFAVKGGSEGDYVHVAVITDQGAAHTLILGKGFEGRDAAWALARRLADILGV